MCWRNYLDYVQVSLVEVVFKGFSTFKMEGKDNLTTELMTSIDRLSVKK